MTRTIRGQPISSLSIRSSSNDIHCPRRRTEGRSTKHPTANACDQSESAPAIGPNGIGEAAFQEVPHLHIHVHPRFTGDNVLRVYPQLPTNTERPTLDSYATILRSHLD